MRENVRKAELKNRGKIRLIFFAKEKEMFDKLFEVVKSIPNRKYKNKIWTIPFNKSNCQLLIDWGFELDEPLREANQNGHNPNC